MRLYKFCVDSLIVSLSLSLRSIHFLFYKAHVDIRIDVSYIR